MKLNLGCGGDIRDGWVNLDLYSLNPRVTRGDAAAPKYNDASIDAILAQDILEHIEYDLSENTLRIWWLLLKPGGTLTIRCPDMAKQAELLLSGYWDWITFSQMCYGGQEHPGNYHKAGFTMEGLQNLLKAVGFDILHAEKLHRDITRDRKTSSNPNLLVIARKP